MKPTDRLPDFTNPLPHGSAQMCVQCEDGHIRLAKHADLDAVLAAMGRQPPSSDTKAWQRELNAIDQVLSGYRKRDHRDKYGDGFCDESTLDAVKRLLKERGEAVRRAESAERVTIAAAALHGGRR